MYASLEGHVEIVKLLIDSGADLNLENDNRETALTRAFRKGNIRSSDS